MHYYRTQDGAEIDLLVRRNNQFLEDTKGVLCTVRLIPGEQPLITKKPVIL